MACFTLLRTHDWICSTALQGVTTETLGQSDDSGRGRKAVMKRRDPGGPVQLLADYCRSTQLWTELTELIAFSLCLLIQTHLINVQSKPSEKLISNLWFRLTLTGCLDSRDPGPVQS